METTAVYAFLKELTRCDYNANAEYDIDQFTYNGISYAQSAEMYKNVLDEMEVAFKSQILEQSSSPQFGAMVKTVLGDFKAAIGQYYDVPDVDTINCMERDFASSHNQSLLQSIREAKFLNEMVSMQRAYVEKSVAFLSPLLGDEMEEVECSKKGAVFVEYVEEKQNNSDYIVGIRNLAEYLHIGITKAQAVVNSKVLEDCSPRVQTNEGKWRFDRKALDKYREKNPDWLSAIKCPH